MSVLRCDPNIIVLQGEAFLIRYVQARQQSATWVGRKQNDITPKCNKNCLAILYKAMAFKHIVPRTGGGGSNSVQRIKKKDLSSGWWQVGDCQLAKNA